MNATEKTVHVRWGLQRDLPEVLAIERASFAHPWGEDDFRHCLRQRNCIMTSAECDLSVIGFMVYELHPNRLHLLNFAVHPAWRRLGVGTLLARRLVHKCGSHRRGFITLDLADTNLAAQLFFRSVGFEAVSVRRALYADTGGDAYRMVRAVARPLPL